MLVSYLFGKTHSAPCFLVSLALFTAQKPPILLCIIVEKQHKVIEIHLKTNYKTCFFSSFLDFQKNITPS